MKYIAVRAGTVLPLGLTTTLLHYLRVPKEAFRIAEYTKM